MQQRNQIYFLEDNNFVNPIKFDTCFKSKRGICIDSILTNKPKRFQNIGLMEAGVSDHHTLIFSLLETTFTKILAKKFQHRNYKLFEVHPFLLDDGNLPEKNSYTEWEKDFCKTVKKIILIRKGKIIWKYGPHLAEFQY